MIYVVLAGAVGAALAGLVTRFRRRWVLVTVHGRSMVPTLEPGDRVLVRRVPPGAVRIGQVVVVEEPVGGAWHTWPLVGGVAPGPERRWIVKRAVAGPGDPVPATVVPAAGSALSRVPPGRFVLLGDNQPESCDSRNFGLVPGDRLLGAVRRVFRPAGRRATSVR
ncbi:S26 family signal peptidase [Plantactinospora sp. S1510]|uniref:S26 family signal peptidase n=1 Tax=Plantactinospora alkalitolerans TaxID=2789879 RepID=A0ABS0GVM2_9ACTN|nr:S26 family signal peptidase [Plantactinospora alkalitolerans]MBF9130241.1 S26 family signal peptidase [Plantactinospora alkalitolerans]